MTKRWGAMPAEWDFFSDGLQLTKDLLPVVSNPERAISPNSHMKSLGKTPSAFNREGLVIGLANWTERESTSQLVSKWENDTDLGMCVQTRFLRAFDVDVKDAVLAASILAFLQSRHQFPIRFRADSAKFLVCFYLEGDFTKRVIKLSTEKKGPMVEFLANGQQFVACGTHSDGARYEWDWRGLAEPPTLAAEEFEEIYTELLTEFGTEEIAATGARKSRIAGAVTVDDDIAKFIETTPYFIGVDKGKVLIDCPWKDNHSTDNGDTQTTYMLAGERDYKRGHFKCLHAGCADKKDPDFLEAIGYNDSLFEPLPAPKSVIVDGKAVALPSFIPFRRGKQQKRGEDMIISELENLMMALERPDWCGYHLHYDEFLGEMMYATKENPAGWRVMDDAGKVRLRLALEQRGFEQVGRELIRDALIEYARGHRFDSAVEWLNNEIPDWDGVPRIETFLTDVAKAEDTTYARAVSRYLWTALAGRVLEPGIKADMVPILVGPQGAGKSMLVEALAPSREFFISLSLHERDDNLARLMKGHLIAELAELSGLKTREIEGIKKFIALGHDSWVPKYQEAQTIYLRRLVFIGTTNADDFLDDATGNRRWLPVEVGMMSMDDIKAFKIFRMQYWAEARDRFLAGGIDWSAQWLASEAHEKYSAVDLWEEGIVRWLDMPFEFEDESSTPRARGFVSREDVFDSALGMDVKLCKKNDEMRLSAIFRKLGFPKVQKMIGGQRVRGWLVA